MPLPNLHRTQAPSNGNEWAQFWSCWSSVSLRKQGYITVGCERTLAGLELCLSDWECGSVVEHLAYTRPWVPLSALQKATN